MKIAVVCVVLALCGLAAADNSMLLFKKFMADHNKLYGSRFEELRRFNIFRDNLNKIEEHNKSGSSAVWAVGQFADLTTEEFLERHTGFRALGKGFDAAPNAELPSASNKDKVDWREVDGVVHHVKNQGSCGSCWAFSTIAGLESQGAIDKGTTVVDLSEQQLVDCDKKSGGCGGGLMHLAIEYVVEKNNGDVDTSDSYPYHAYGGSCKDKQSTAGLSGVTGYNLYCTCFAGDNDTCDEDKMTGIVEKHPTTFAQDATPLQHYSHGVVDGGCSRRPNHALLFVGFGKEQGKDVWYVKNSWGSRWGMDGYYMITRGHGTCGLDTYVMDMQF